MKNKRRRFKKSALELGLTKIHPIKVSHDKKGNYINYCSFGNHYGVIGSVKAKECKDRDCNYYRKYREEK